MGNPAETGWKLVRWVEDGYAAHAVIEIGAVHVLDDLAANHHRVDGRAAHPTARKS